MQEVAARLIDLLGYSGTDGHVGPATLEKVEPSFRSAVDHAFRSCKVVDVFGLPMRSSRTTHLVPIVYLATALNDEDALEVHKALWTQGTVPFALIATSRGVWCCDAFAPPSAVESRTFIRSTEITRRDVLPKELSHLTALSLRVSLARPDKPATEKSRVDEKLLNNLRSLAKDLTDRASRPFPLSADAANALIGRLLFLRFLKDRSLVPDAWIPQLPAREEDRSAWLQGVWNGLKRADEVFNGSAFPLSENDRQLITSDAAATAFSVIMDGSDFNGTKVQLSFKEFRFASLRTETLSAVYELFLELSQPDQKSEDGAVYTPPFLADHVLMKVADQREFGRRDTVLDCAAGSGIFLVGAFRRIVEASLPQGSRVLPLRILHQIMTRSIWGFEPNGSACHVAALSLYLTMLDYADPIEVNRLIRAKVPRRRVLPELVGRNILERDFFGTQPPQPFPVRFDFVLANPPWIKLGKPGTAISNYVLEQDALFTDAGRAAPAFLHKAISRCLHTKGVFGFVMSARAVISSAAQHFPDYLITHTGLNACSNLSNLRRKLFIKAEHPAVVLVGRASREEADPVLRVFHPNQMAQPLAQDGRHWILIEDRTEQRGLRRDLLKTPDDLIDALMLTPADQRFRQWMMTARQARGLSTLGDVIKDLKMVFSRGGTPIETGVASKWLLNATKGDSLYYKNALFGRDLLQQERLYVLPENVVSQAKPAYRKLFSGNIILFPRNGANCVFVKHPVAFNSSFYGIRLSDDAAFDEVFLQSLTDYLNSKFAEYCNSVNGRDWSIDERRLEREQVLNMPVPPRLTRPASSGPGKFLPVTGPADITTSGGLDAIASELRLPAFVTPLVQEFNSFRQLFQNGRRNSVALQNVSKEQRRTYEKALEDELQRFINKSAKYLVRSEEHLELGLGAVAALHTSHLKLPSTPQRDRAALQSDLSGAARRFAESGADLSGTGSWLSRSDHSSIILVKPLSRTHWTVERAFEDAGLIIDDVLSRPMINA
ncbi:MAG: N-6 DNA methylase [Janthinobacterium lividum]